MNLKKPRTPSPFAGMGKHRLALVTLVLVSGCGQPPGKLPEQQVLDKEAEQKAAQKGETRQFESEGGEITIYDDKVKTKPRWMVRWKNAVLDFQPGDSKFGGKLGLVEGVIYRNSQTASNFKAKEAFTKPGSNILQLIGGVEIVSTGDGTPAGRVFCQEAFYYPDKGKIVARGPMKVELMGYVMSGLEEIWAREDMTEISTPSLWDSK